MSNPFLNGDAFGVVGLTGGGAPVGFTLAGALIAIDGANTPDEYAVQKGTGTSGATVTWRGSKVAEAVKLTFALTNAAQWAAAEAQVAILRPTRGQKPPSFTIVNPVINNFGKISRVSTVDPGQPKWDEKVFKFTIEIVFIEFRPTVAAKTSPVTPPTDPNADLKNQAAVLIPAAQAAATKFFAGGAP